MRTPLSELLGVDLPLCAFSHCRDVVAAVAGAGGFGVLGATRHTAEELEAELAWIDAHVGGRPYGVDVLIPASLRDTEMPTERTSLAERVPDEHRRFLASIVDRYALPPLGAEPQRTMDFGSAFSVGGALALVEVALRHPIRLIASALGPAPPELVERARAKGVAVAGLVGSVEHARRQVDAGVDIIIAQGHEAGGHTGEITTMVLVPQVVDAVAPVPVLAAGGIASGRQMAAALALGAAGVWLGSVWLTTVEAETHPTVVRKMLSATSADTVRTRATSGKPMRQLRTAWADEWAAPGAPAPLPMPLQSVLVAEIGFNERVANAAHDQASGAGRLITYPVGQVVGMMNSVRSSRDVVYDIMTELAATLGRLNELPV